MGQREVKEKNLNQRPVLLIIKVMDEKYLDFFNSIESLTQLDDQEQSHVNNGGKVSEAINEDNYNAYGVSEQIILCIVIPNLSQVIKPFALLEFNGKKVDDHFTKIENQADCLNALD